MLLNVQKSFGLGTSGNWVKLGKGVLGRNIPLAIIIVIAEVMLGGIIGYASPGDIAPFAYFSIIIDFLMFAIAMGWAHLHPKEAASEGKEYADIIRAEAYASKTMGVLPPSRNIVDPRSSESLRGPPIVGQLTADAHARMPEQLSLPKPEITPKKEKGK